MKAYLDKAAVAYFDGNPIMSDDEWDHLMTVTNYRKVGAAATSALKIKHRYPLYSLNKFYIGDKLPFVYKHGVVLTPKLDGSAIALTYINGELCTAATRGDGIEGEDITHNFIGWEGVPQTIMSLYHCMQVIGELVASKTIENSRNYAAGAARLKDHKEFLSREVTFIAYGVESSVSSTYTYDMLWLEGQDFCTIFSDNLTHYFPTDGKVFRIDNNEEYKRLGYTAQFPRGAYALKNVDDVAKVHTELLEVIWQVGKSGKVTPVAIFEEIDIDGAKINRATLHNAGFIENLNLYLGDTIIVTRAGGIIPKVLGVVEI